MAHFDMVGKNDGMLDMNILRGVVAGKHAIRSDKEMGALWALWSASAWTMARKHEAGLATSPHCRARGALRDDHPHQWVDCAKVDEILDEENVEARWYKCVVKGRGGLVDERCGRQAAPLYTSAANQRI